MIKGNDVNREILDRCRFLSSSQQERSHFDMDRNRDAKQDLPYKLICESPLRMIHVIDVLVHHDQK